MMPFLRWACVVALTSLGSAVQADDSNAIIEKAIKAFGGREKLEKLHVTEVKTKGTINIGGNEGPFSGQAIVQGLDHYRMQFEGEFAGNKITGMTVVNGNKGWKKFGDDVAPLDKDALRNEQRMLYLQLAVSNPNLLTSKGFKVIKADKGAITATGPDGKEFTIHYDATTGLPTKLVATVLGFTGEENKQETTYSDYKDFDGIKRATKTVTKRDGEPFLKQNLVEFKVVGKVDAKTFNQPK
jgi:hypothetical protein